MKRLQLEELAKRAAWTFAQSFIAVLVVSNAPFTKTALIAALAAGLSALKTFALVSTRNI